MNSDDQIDISVQRGIVTKAMTSIRVHYSVKVRNNRFLNNDVSLVKLGITVCT
jgi:hypothetical protein